MLAIRLGPEIEKRLEVLARKAGRTKADYAREAILEHLADLEDIHLASRRLEGEGQARTCSAAEIKRELGL